MKAAVKVRPTVAFELEGQEIHTIIVVLETYIQESEIRSSEPALYYQLAELIHEFRVGERLYIDAMDELPERFKV